MIHGDNYESLTTPTKYITTMSLIKELTTNATFQ